MEICQDRPHKFLHLRHLPGDRLDTVLLDLTGNRLLPEQAQALALQEAHGQVLHLPPQSARDLNLVHNAGNHNGMAILRLQFHGEMAFPWVLHPGECLLPYL